MTDRKFERSSVSIERILLQQNNKMLIKAMKSKNEYLLLKVGNCVHSCLKGEINLN